MRIVIDMQGAQSHGSRTRGIGRYSTSLAKAIIRNRREHEVVLALNGNFADAVRAIKAEFSDLLPPENIRVWHPIGPVAFCNRDNDQRRLTAEAHRELFLHSLSPDVVLVSSHIEGFSDDAVTSIGTLPSNYPTCVVLYDLIPLIHKKPYLTDDNVRRWYLNRIAHLKNADALFAISESSRQEAVELLEYDDQMAFNVGTDADPQFKRAPLSVREWASLKSRYGISKPFVMYTGGIDHRKNIDALIRSFAKLPTDVRAAHQLAIVCSVQADEKARLLSLARDAGLADGEVILTGFVAENDLIALYSRCELFVFPSLHEGFGLPVLEAMRCGAPVIASNRSSLPEVVGSKAAMFNPGDEKSITRAMARALGNPEQLAKLRKNSIAQRGKFSWDGSAKRAIAGFESVVADRAKAISDADDRPSLAYLSPLPPARSGIADYSAEILPELARHYRIDVVHTRAGGPASGSYASGDMRLIDQDVFEQTWRDYDRIVYQIGNSDHHDHMFGLLDKTGGVAILHDFFLSSIMEYREAIHPPHNALATELYRSHGYPALTARAQAQRLEDIVWKYPCSRLVFDRAEGVVVHSNYAARLANAWYGEAVAVDTTVVPLPRAPASDLGRDVARQGLSVDDGTFLVCSFGMIGPTKRSHQLIDAWHEGGFGKQVNSRLVFVGENNPGEYGRILAEKIEQHGLTNVEITGWTEESQYKTFLAAADVAVQLRAMSRGETSAAALDCLNFGVPVIVNANGSMAELPTSAAIILPDEFDVVDLVSALQNLQRDPQQRQRMGKNGQSVIRETHDPSNCAQQYRMAIEGYYSRSATGRAFERIIARLDVDSLTLVTVAERVTQDIAKPEKRLFVDISVLARFDAKTGIQRVVRNLLREIASQDHGLRVEPCYLDQLSGRFRHARKFMETFLDVSVGDFGDDIIDIGPSDTLLLLDFNPIGLMSAANYLRDIRGNGSRVVFVVYDLLPIKHPDCFEANAEAHHRRWIELVLSTDLAICISASVAADLRRFAETQDTPATARITHFPLGSDFERPADGRKTDEGSTKPSFKSGQTFLMVGTLEPRKGHALVLEAFEKLWARGVDVNLCIVGKKGWLVDELVGRIERVARKQKRLRWYADASDAELAKFYDDSTCLIAASLDEGFGLPLIEAAHFDLPIIARDIPVFREVGGSNAAYFSSENAAELAEFVKQWLVTWKQGRVPRSSGINSISWGKSALKLMAVLGEDQAAQFQIR